MFIYTNSIGNLSKCKKELLYFQLLLSMPYIKLMLGLRGIHMYSRLDINPDHDLCDVPVLERMEMPLDMACRKAGGDSLII